MLEAALGLAKAVDGPEAEEAGVVVCYLLGVVLAERPTVVNNGVVRT